MKVEYRRGTADDSKTAFQIFFRSFADFSRRFCLAPPSGEDDPEKMEQRWQNIRPLFEHLALTADQFWIASVDGKAVGYARSVLRDGVRDLTEFFVLPDNQSAGVGKELLERAFPQDGAKHRTIIATTDVRALVRYLKAGVFTRFLIQNFSREPRTLEPPRDMEAEPLEYSQTSLEILRDLDQAILTFTRDEEHAWWLQDRQGLLFRKDGRVVGYGYAGKDGGPFALLEKGDFPAALTLAEREAARVSDRFYLEVPLNNKAAVNHLLSQGYKMDSFTAVFMSDEPFGHFDRYIFPSPPFTI